MGVVADIRNGNVHGVGMPVRAGAIPAEYHWREVTSGSRQYAQAAAGYWAATAYADLAAVHAATQAAVAALPGAAGAPAGTLASFNAVVAAAAADADLRVSAIVLGVLRAGISGYYTLQDAEILPGERAARSWITFVPVAPGDPGAPAVIDEPLPAGAAAGAVQRYLAAGGSARLTSGHADARANLVWQEALALSFAPLSEDEMAMCAVLLKVAVASVAYAGASLMESHHHYLRVNANQGMYLGVERQITAALPDAFRGNFFVGARSVMIRDLVWHKAAHPIVRSVLEAAAQTDAIGEAMKRIGLGSAAIRIPWAEPEVRAAKAYMALYDYTLNTAMNAGATLRVRRLARAVQVVRFVPMQGYDAQRTPTNVHEFVAVVDRADFIARYLVPAFKDAGRTIAICAGIYQGLRDRIGAAAGADTIGTAWCIRRLVAERGGDVAEGMDLVQALGRLKRRYADEGEVFEIFSSDDPNDRAPVAAAGAAPAPAQIAGAPAAGPGGAPP